MISVELIRSFMLIEKYHQAHLCFHPQLAPPPASAYCARITQKADGWDENNILVS